MLLERLHDVVPEFQRLRALIFMIAMPELWAATPDQFHVDPASPGFRFLPGAQQCRKSNTVTQPHLDQSSKDAPPAYRRVDGIGIPSIGIRRATGDPVERICNRVSLEDLPCNRMFIISTDAPDHGRTASPDQ